MKIKEKVLKEEIKKEVDKQFEVRKKFGGVKGKAGILGFGRMCYFVGRTNTLASVGKRIMTYPNTCLDCKTCDRAWKKLKKELGIK